MTAMRSYPQDQPGHDFSVTHFVGYGVIAANRCIKKKNIYIPIGSMYGIYANIWGILMVNVTIYGIHGSYGINI